MLSFTRHKCSLEIYFLNKFFFIQNFNKSASLNIVFDFVSFQYFFLIKFMNKFGFIKFFDNFILI